MKTLVYIPSGLSTPELEIMCARVQSAIDAGDEVMVGTCTGSKGYACSINTHSLRPVCHVCRTMVNKGLAAIEGNYIRISTPPLTTKPRVHFKDRWAIKSYTVDGIDVGQATYSSYVAQSRDQDLEGRLAQRSLNLLLSTTEQLACWFSAMLEKHKFDRAVLYNGRQNQYRPLLRVASRRGLPVEVMEFSGIEANCVYMFRNKLPQDLEALQEAINECWEHFNGDAKAVADAYYAFKREGGIVNNFSGAKAYVTEQTRGLLPVGWDKTKHNVVVYNNSEDEMSALGGEFDETLYLNQTEALHRICESLQDDSDVVIWLRIHPNLAAVRWSFAEKLLLLGERFANIRVIPGDSKVSSYDLLDACDTAVTFGSTMGIEATYWGKPSILLGRCVYERFGSVYTPHTHEEAVGLIRTRNLAVLPVEGAMKIAVFWKGGGQSIAHFTGSRTQRFRFNGKLLMKSRALNLFYGAAKFFEKIICEQWLNYYLGKTHRYVREYRRHAHTPR